MQYNELMTSPIQNYRNTAIQMCKLYFPQLQYHELCEAIDHSIMNKFQNNEATVFNNYKNQTVETTLLELSEYILSRKPILTSFGVLFQQHDSGTVNPLLKLFQFYLNDRARLKELMLSFPKGSEEFEHYNLAQYIRKVNANSI